MNARNSIRVQAVLSQQLEGMHGRLTELYRSLDTTAMLSPELVPTALKELGIASEELQVAVEELTYRNEELVASHHHAQQIHLRYRRLFDLAPDAYVLTNLNGTIEEANHAAARLLNTEASLLTGKPFVSLVPFDDRGVFRNQLLRLTERDRLEFCVRLQRRSDEAFYVTLVADVVRDEIGNPFIVRWLLRDVSEQKRAELAAAQVDYNPVHDRPMQIYRKGDLIPLETQSICLVVQGLIKLTTLSDRGEEMLVGLASAGMTFGSSLTAFPFYQASALTEVKLVSISFSEVARSLRLAQVLLPLIAQRVKQTEQFLAVYGQLLVEDRLARLIDLLKQEVGEPTDSGIRLKVRLTHQDIASACGTTRVTITRLLGKLQKEGKLKLDSQSHWILCD